MIQEIWQHHREFRKEKELRKYGSEEPLQPLPLPCSSVRAGEKGLDDRNCFMSMTNRAAGIGTCTQIGTTIPSYPSSEVQMHGISELDCKLPNRCLLEGKESHAHSAVDQGNRSSRIAG